MEAENVQRQTGITLIELLVALVIMMVAVAMLAAIASTVLASAFPARNAARMDPIQVMK